MSRVPVFPSAEAALAAARARAPRWPSHNSLAMYSSALGGITTDPAMMVVPLDDHLVHRGHCVFDTANVHAGRTYGLDFHLDRLFKSAQLARIERLPPRQEIKDAILATIAVAGERDGVYARYWLSAGRGDFFVSPRGLRDHGAVGSEEGRASFYAVVHRGGGKGLAEEGVAEATVAVPLKTKLLANIKSNNYLLNALTAMEAEDKGGCLGVQLDERGCLVESSIASIAVVTAAGELKSPTFDHALASTTLLRAFELARGAVGRAELPMLRSVEQAAVPLDEAYAASEVLSLGGGGIVPITSLDGRQIGSGRPGPVYRALWRMLQEDLSNGEHTDAVPYELYHGVAEQAEREA